MFVIFLNQILEKEFYFKKNNKIYRRAEIKLSFIYLKIFFFFSKAKILYYKS
jgi:hypothetical protein